MAPNTAILERKGKGAVRELSLDQLEHLGSRALLIILRMLWSVVAGGDSRKECQPRAIRALNQLGAPCRPHVQRIELAGHAAL